MDICIYSYIYPEKDRENKKHIILYDLAAEVLQVTSTTFNSLRQVLPSYESWRNRLHLLMKE